MCPLADVCVCALFPNALNLCSSNRRRRCSCSDAYDDACPLTSPAHTPFEWALSKPIYLHKIFWVFMVLLWAMVQDPDVDDNGSVVGDILFFFVFFFCCKYFYLPVSSPARPRTGLSCLLSSCCSVGSAGTHETYRS